MLKQCGLGELCFGIGDDGVYARIYILYEVIPRYATNVTVTVQLGNFLLVIPCMLIQFVSLIWYDFPTLSFICISLSVSKSVNEPGEVEPCLHGQ